MGLDVYVGSLTRYYAGDWQTILQQMSREQGIPVRVIRPNGPRDAVTDQEQIRSAVVQWRAALSEALGPNLHAPLLWDESSAAPYFTDKPDWDGYHALMLWAAYEEHPGLQKPDALPGQWGSDPAIRASAAEGFRSRYGQLLYDAELWLPCGFDFTFRAPDVAGNEVWIGSSVTLLSQLRELDAATWNASPDALEDWRRDGAVHGATLEVCATYGFAIFLHLAEQSVAHRLPMKLDY